MSVTESEIKLKIVQKAATTLAHYTAVLTAIFVVAGGFAEALSFSYPFLTGFVIPLLLLGMVYFGFFLGMIVIQRIARVVRAV